MSYILDALKKSERERRNASIPDPLTVHGDISGGRKRRYFWPYLLTAVLVLNAAVFAFRGDILHSKKPVVTTGTASENPQRVKSPDTPDPATPTGSEILAVNKENVPAKADRLSEVRSPKKINGSGQKRADAEVRKKTEDLQKHAVNRKEEHAAQAASMNTPEAEPDGNNSAAVPNRIYSLGELPSSVRQGLPTFSISVFLYSDDPASRLVKVNGRMMKEGQYLADGLKVDQIVSNGVIFSYQNYRFYLGLK